MHSPLQDRRRVRVGIVGVGNCASSLVQGLAYYRHAEANEPVPGLMNVSLGEYHVGDVEISAAFDVNRAKVGKDVGEAIFASPNNTRRFARIKVHRQLDATALERTQYRRHAMCG